MPDPSPRRLPALDGLQRRPRAARADTSDLRLYIRDNFASMLAARGRGASWQQITEVMAAAGVRAPDGSDLQWRKVAISFHMERYERDKRKRRTPRPKVRRGAAPSPVRPEALGPPPVTPTRPGVREGATPDPETSESPAPAPAPEAEGLRALLARRRPDLREPDPINLDPEDRRRRTEDE